MLSEIYRPIQSVLDQIESDLSEFESSLKQATFSVSDSKHFKINKGKKIRAALVLFCAGLASEESGDSSPDARKVALAVELLHFASLVHDDILDQEKERRGAEPVYQQLSLRKAVLLGDYIMAQSLMGLPESVYERGSKSLLSVVSQMCVGEFIQLQMRESIMALPEYRQAYQEVNFRKTALLFGQACWIGSHLSPQLSPSNREHLQIFGEHFGLAFQLLDDSLEITDQITESNTPRNFDASQGILTLPYLIYADEILKIHDVSSFTQFKQQLMFSDYLMHTHRKMIEDGIFSRVADEIQLELDFSANELQDNSSPFSANLLLLVDHLREKCLVLKSLS